MDKSKNYKLEKRIKSFSKQNISIQTINDLEHYYQEGMDSMISFFKNQFPVKYVKKFIDWDKVDRLYKQTVEMLVEECGESMVKEWQVINQTKGLTGDEFKENLYGFIIDVYGSLDTYSSYGDSLKQCGEELNQSINRTKFSLIEKITIKQIYKGVVKQLKETGQEISEMCKE